MKRIISAAVVCALGFMLISRSASAGVIVASASWTDVKDADGVNHDYTITLHNSAASTDVIGTFWFSWVPGADFMANSPISENTPAGWVATVTHVPNIPTNGFAIQWVANTGSELTIGDSLTFGFKSAETPAELAGTPPLILLNGQTFAEGVTVVYNGAPFSADSLTIVATQGRPRAFHSGACARGRARGCWLWTTEEVGPESRKSGGIRRFFLGPRVTFDVSGPHGHCAQQYCGSSDLFRSLDSAFIIRHHPG